MEKKRRCIVYHACREKSWIKMARNSARSAKRHMPDVDTVVLTDLPCKSGWFDEVVSRPRVEEADAHFPPLWLLPNYYASGLYTGCNSYFCAPMYDVFELVEEGVVDVASVHTSGKQRDYVYPACGVPRAYPYMRSALLAFQDNERVRAFFALWKKLFYEHRVKYRKQMAHEGSNFPDQGSMRIALYRSGLNVAVLPPRFCTTCGEVVVRKGVYMLAGTGDMEALARQANRHNPFPRLLYRGKSIRLEGGPFG